MIEGKKDFLGSVGLFHPFILQAAKNFSAQVGIARIAVGLFSSLSYRALAVMHYWVSGRTWPSANPWRAVDLAIKHILQSVSPRRGAPHVYSVVQILSWVDKLVPWQNHRRWLYFPIRW